MRAFLKSAFGSVIAVVVFFAVVSFFSVRSSRTMIVTQAEEAVRNLVKTTTGKIDRLMSDVETAVASQKWIIGEKLSDPDYMYKITRELVENRPYIVGSSVAFKPNYYKSKGRFYAPYTCQDADGSLTCFQLGTEDNDYFTQSWYADAFKARKAIWSEPYFDEGGAKIMMSTYSMPIFDSATNICAIFTADLSLAQLMDYVAQIRPYKNSYVIMKAGDKVLVGGEEEKAKRAGAYVGKVLNIVDRADNGWTVEVGCPIEEIMRGPQKIINRIIVFSALGLCLILGVSVFYTSRLQKSTAMRERMAGEFNTARNIQSGILPKDFPENVYAVLRPAREVGGDLYDFVRRGDKIYFIVGDASGKGVPAALFSFMAEAAFQMCCSMNLDPGEICGRINEALSRNNEMSMFVTAFVGALDLKTGELKFGCAGHNPPVIVTADGKASFLTVKRGPPTGAMSGVFYPCQTVQIPRGAKIVVYTDGITEAARVNHAQYGESRLLEFASACGERDVRSTTVGLLSSVDCFVDGAEQSDDITIMTVGMPA